MIAYLKSLWGDETSLGLSKRESQAEASKRPFPPVPQSLRQPMCADKERPPKQTETATEQV